MRNLSIKDTDRLFAKDWRGTPTCNVSISRRHICNDCRRDRAGMPNVAVLVTSKTGSSMANLTDAEGVCSFSSLYPGNYTVRAILEGYNDVVVNNIMVATGKTVPVPIKLEPVNAS